MRLRTASSALFVLLVACGGAGAPPLQPDTAHDGGGGGGAAKPSAPEPSATTASAAPPAAPEPKDDCTPVGVDFEKRARPKMKECYATAKKKEPNLQGTVKITLDIDTLGKVKGIKIVEKTLPDPVAQCMLKAVKGTPLPEASKCPGKSFTIPMTFPTPH
jgi:hypothetical protein